MNRNVDASIKTMWHKTSAFDPFYKSMHTSNAEDFVKILSLCCEPSNQLQDEIAAYIREPSPENQDLDIIKFWIDAGARYLSLSKSVLTLLSIPTGSCDVERSFSHLRHLQTPERNGAMEETVCMQMMLYVNNKLSFD